MQPLNSIWLNVSDGVKWKSVHSNKTPNLSFCCILGWNGVDTKIQLLIILSPTFIWVWCVIIYNAIIRVKQSFHVFFITSTHNIFFKQLVRILNNLCQLEIFWIFFFFNEIHQGFWFLAKTYCSYYFLITAYFNF